jgi:hypothetical protein
VESNIDDGFNVPLCVFVPDDLDDVLLPDFSTIDVNVLKSEIDDTTNCTVESTIADNDSVGNTSLASLAVYKVFDDDIEYCFHGPKIVPQNEMPATICTVNTIGSIRSR